MKKREKIAQIARGEMKRILGVTDLFAVGYGDLGSSIYYALGITALYALGATPIALLFAGLVFACTALTYAELSSMISTAGGTASFSRYAFNDLISFIAGWGLLLDFIVTIAISAYSVAPYLSYFFPFLKLPVYKIGFTSFLILSLLLLNIWGTKESTRISLWLTGLTLVTQILIILVGLFWLGDIEGVIKNLVINDPGNPNSPSWSDFFKGCAMAMVAYTGIESMSQLSGEAKTPSRTVPRAIILAMGTLILAYLGISVVALSAVSASSLATTFIEDPIAGIVQSFPFGGAILGPWVGLLAAVILIVAANAGLIGSSRLSFNMGEYYQLPRFFYRLHHSRKTPFVSLTVFAFLAIIIVIASRAQLSFLADLYNFGAMLAFFSAHLSLIVLRIRRPDDPRPFRAPLNIKVGRYKIPLTSIVGLIFTFATWLLVIITKPDGRILGFSWIAIGLTMYLIYRKRHRIAPAAQIEIEKIKVPEYKPATFRHILVPTGGGESSTTFQMACEAAKMHGAKLLVVHVIEVPFSVSLEARMYERQKAGERILKRAEAIAEEFGVTIELELIKARSIPKAILELVQKREIDLVIMDADTKEPHYGGSLGSICEQVLQGASCPVWVHKS